MKLNSKGQVTIPAGLRHRHGLVEGDDVDVVDDGGVLRIVRRDSASSGERAVRRVRGVTRRGPSTDEILAMTRGE